jgi:hypothetical protein
MTNYAIIPNRGIYYFSKRKKTKFVPLFKICKVNGTTLEEFHRLIEQIEAAYPPDQAENLVRKLLNAIRDKDARKFTRTVRRTDADS